MDETSQCSEFGEAFWRLIFDAYDQVERCSNEQAIFAFATLAAFSFAAFVVIDLMVLLVRRYGFAAKGAGELGIDGVGTVGSILMKALGVIVFGTIAAWIVAFFGAIVEFVQTAPQTAVATGVLWQVTYAQLLSRFGGRDADRPPRPEAPEDQRVEDGEDEAEMVLQRTTEEVVQ